MNSRKYEQYLEFCEKARNNGNQRILDSHERFNSQKHYIDFVSNDYLNLKKDKRLIEAACLYARKYGVGSGSSRLLNFHLEIYKEFEDAIAQDKKKKAALILNSGYQTNATVLAALMNKNVLKQEPLVFCDRLNHASIHHACQLAGVKQIRYSHCDLNHLELLLEQHNLSNRPKFIITESVFSMDGDITNLSELARLKRKYDAFLYIDEAHATGIFGYGLTSKLAQNDIDAFDVIMGTFSKALGSFGSYIATEPQIKDYLIHSCTGLIYSTSLSPMIIGAAHKAWNIIGTTEMEEKAANLLLKANLLRRNLKNDGWNVINGTSQIIAIIPYQLEDFAKEKEAEKVMIIAKALRKNHNIFVAPIRPPTVLQSRLRINICLQHSEENLLTLLKALNSYITI